MHTTVILVDIHTYMFNCPTEVERGFGEEAYFRLVLRFSVARHYTYGVFRTRDSFIRDPEDLYGAVHTKIDLKLNRSEIDLGSPGESVHTHLDRSVRI